MSTCCSGVVPQNAARPFTNPAPVLLKPRVQRLFAQTPRGQALEIGAGCLRNSFYLLSAGFHVTAVDVPAIEQRFPLQYAKFRNRGGHVIFTKPTETASYHVAVCTFVIETICQPTDRADLLIRTRNALKPRGFLVISTRGPADVVTARAEGIRCSDGYITPNKSFARSFTRDQLCRLLLSSGFAEVEFLHKLGSKSPELLHAIAYRARTSDE